LTSDISFDTLRVQTNQPPQMTTSTLDTNDIHTLSKEEYVAKYWDLTKDNVEDKEYKTGFWSNSAPIVQSLRKQQIAVQWIKYSRLNEGKRSAKYGRKYCV